MLSLTSIFIGFAIGSAAMGIVWQLTSRQIRNPERTRLSGVWSIPDVSDGHAPAIVAHGIRDDVTVPAGSKVIVPAAAGRVPASVLDTCTVRMHPDVHLNAAIGAERALIFSGAIAKRTTAVTTHDEATVKQLQRDFQRLWSESKPHVEPASLETLATKIGRVVEVKGRASGVVEFRHRKMLKLTDGNAAVGVITRDGEVSRYQGGHIRVVGVMKRENGTPFIEAETVTLEEAPETRPAVMTA